MFPQEWREAIARDLQVPTPLQGRLSELYMFGRSKKRKSFSDRLAQALDVAGVDDARAKRIVAAVPESLQAAFDNENDANNDDDDDGNN